MYCRSVFYFLIIKLLLGQKRLHPAWYAKDSAILEAIKLGFYNFSLLKTPSFILSCYGTTDFNQAKNIFEEKEKKSLEIKY